MARQTQKTASTPRQPQPDREQLDQNAPERQGQRDSNPGREKSDRNRQDQGQPGNQRAPDDPNRDRGEQQGGGEESAHGRKQKGSQDLP